MDKELNTWISNQTKINIKSDLDLLKVAHKCGYKISQEYDDDFYVIKTDGFCYIHMGKKPIISANVKKRLYLLIIKSLLEVPDGSDKV